MSNIANSERQTERDLRKQARDFVRKSSFYYSIMIVVALGVMHFAFNSVQTTLTWPHEIKESGRILAIGGLGAGLLMIVSGFFEDWFSGYRQLKALVMQLFGGMTWWEGFFLAALTAVGEELLFRGAIQPACGLVLTALFFGLVHMGQGALISSWSVWAFIAGLLLGWMSDETHSLWPAIIAHFIVNAVSIETLRRTYQRLKEKAHTLELSVSGRD